MMLKQHLCLRQWKSCHYNKKKHCNIGRYIILSQARASLKNSFLDRQLSCCLHYWPVVSPTLPCAVLWHDWPVVSAALSENILTFAEIWLQFRFSAVCFILKWTCRHTVRLSGYWYRCIFYMHLDPCSPSTCCVQHLPLLVITDLIIIIIK